MHREYSDHDNALAGLARWAAIVCGPEFANGRHLKTQHWPAHEY